MFSKKELINRIYNQEDATEVLNFLNDVAPEKETFRNETTLVNFLARKLEPKLKVLAKSSKSEEEYLFWNSRIISMDTIRNPINKEKNVLWCIRLLSGKCKAPQFSEDQKSEKVERKISFDFFISKKINNINLNINFNYNIMTILLFEFYNNL